MRSISLILNLLIFMTPGCQNDDVPGYLHIEAPKDGRYEVYRIAFQRPLQFVSEQVGYFNKNIALSPGSYLILADCSYETVIIYPGSTKILNAHSVVFQPPIAPSPEDRFSIQCTRFEDTRLRQHLTNRFELFVLAGMRKMLVGMVPIELDLTSKQERVHRFDLSALQVNRPKTEEQYETTSYFTSPANELLAITDPQEFGNWQFLLPGAYNVEVNGVRKLITLKENELLRITPALLRISTPPDVDLGFSESVQGNPHSVLINGEHLFSLNIFYPILPGSIEVSLDGSVKTTPLQIEEGQTYSLMARSIVVKRGCSPWEWRCLGGRGIQLYRGEEPYPFLEKVSDVPILYLEDDVWLEVQGSRNIHFKIPEKKQVYELKLGQLELVPTPAFRNGFITDLARLETFEPFRGHSLDIDLEKPSDLPLLSGTYKLATYTSIANSDGERYRTEKIVRIKPGKTTKIHFKVYHNEKRFQALDGRAKNKRRIDQREAKVPLKSFEFL